MNKSYAKPPRAFSQYTLKDRLHYIAEKTGLSPFDIQEALEAPAQTPDLAEALIEASLGYFSLPLGLVKSLIMNGKVYCIPLVIEETSVVAALNKMASWAERSGRLTAHVNGNQKDQTIIGQIQIATLKDPEAFKQHVENSIQEWINLANTGPAATLFKRGGGVTDIKLRLLPRQKDAGIMGVLHVHLNPCEAMGANQVTQVCEFLKPRIEAKTNESVALCILSNLTDQKLTTATLVLENIDPELGYKIEEASHFASCDPYRAATHNKGIMNGIDALVIATGNDWRAVEAGLHSYGATKDKASSYIPLATWEMKGADLVGTFTGPIAIGTVGG
ncbi:MAG TPA: hydroxymethylglutaryl-CoA reductase, degradative [Holosporales bacterium]|nr:hydroxymethylglutaryl-CoA reductase, degradative [Holosporales bacterium]